jgi:hypothetical protein
MKIGWSESMAFDKMKIDVADYGQDEYFSFMSIFKFNEEFIEIW